MPKPMRCGAGRNAPDMRLPEDECLGASPFSSVPAAPRWHGSLAGASCGRAIHPVSVSLLASGERVAILTANLALARAARVRTLSSCSLVIVLVGCGLLPRRSNPPCLLES